MLPSAVTASREREREKRAMELTPPSVATACKGSSDAAPTSTALIQALKDIDTDLRYEPHDHGSAYEAVLSSSPRRASRKQYPRLQTLELLAESHTEALHHGDFVKRSRERWLRFQNRASSTHESDAFRAHRIARESAALVIQCAWRCAAAVRLREQHLRVLWSQNMAVAAWVTRDTALLGSLLKMVCFDQCPLVAIASVLHGKQIGKDDVAIPDRGCLQQEWVGGIRFQLAAMLITRWMRLRVVHRRYGGHYLRRPPAVLHSVDIPVIYTFRLITHTGREISTHAAQCLQVHVRSYQARGRYWKLLARHRRSQAALQLQCWYRVVLARRIVAYRRRRLAGICIQCAWRCFISRRCLRRRRMTGCARQLIGDILINKVHTVAIKLLHMAALKIQRVYRGLRARARFRVLLGAQEQSSWRRNPSRGYQCFEQGLYSLAAVFLECCFQEGAYQTQADDRTPLVEQLTFWLAYAKSHFKTYEATGDRINLRQARVGWETFLRVDSLQTDATDASQNHVINLRLPTSHLDKTNERQRALARFRLVQCMYWDAGGNPDERSRTLECCVELLDDIESDYNEQAAEWRLDLLLMSSMLYATEGHVEQSCIQLEALIACLPHPHAPIRELEARFVYAFLLLELDAKQQSIEEQRLPGTFQHSPRASSTRTINLAESHLKWCFQTIELQPSVGFYHGRITTEEARKRLDATPVGTFLLHHEPRLEEESSAIAEEALASTMLLQVKHSNDPIKISAMRIISQNGVYRAKRVADCSHFSVHGLCQQLPPAAGIIFDNGIRLAPFVDHLHRNLQNRRSQWLNQLHQRHALVLSFGTDLSRRIEDHISHVHLHSTRRNWPRMESWSALCFEMALALEQTQAFDFSEMVARDGLRYSRDRVRRAQLSFATARAEFYMQRNINGSQAMQRATIEAAVLTGQGHSEPFDVNFVAIKRALSRYVTQTKREKFSCQLERVRKLERMCIRAWGYDSLSQALRGQPFCEALLLQRIFDEMYSSCADLFFLRRLLKAHVRSFLENGSFEALHLDVAWVSLVQTMHRRHGQHRHIDGDIFNYDHRRHHGFRQLRTLQCNDDVDSSIATENPTIHAPRRHAGLTFNNLDVVLLTWHKMPIRMCFEVAEVIYRSPKSPSHTTIAAYESLYGRLRGSKPRRSTYVAYEELVLMRLAFLFALPNSLVSDKLEAREAKATRVRFARSVELLSELIANRQIRMLSTRQTDRFTERIDWPRVLVLPLKLSLSCLIFLRGYFRELLENTVSDAEPNHNHKKPHSHQVWSDYEQLHRELLQLVIMDHNQSQGHRSNDIAASLHGIRIYVGETQNVGFADIMHSKPMVTVQCQGSRVTSQHAPTWMNLTPCWDEHIDIDVTSPHARLTVTLKDRTWRSGGEGMMIGQVHIYVEELLQRYCDGVLDCARYYDLTQPSGTNFKSSLEQPRLQLGFQIMSKASGAMRNVGPSANRSNGSTKHSHRRHSPNGWDLDALSRFLHGDLRTFVQSRWIWSWLGEMWLEDQDYGIARPLFFRAVQHDEGGKIDPEHIPICVRDALSLAKCYRATIPEPNSFSLVQSVLDHAQALLKAFQYAAYSVDLTAISKQLIVLKSWLDRGATEECTEDTETHHYPLAKALASKTPASSHWIKMTHVDTSTDVAGSPAEQYFFNQDTGVVFETIEAEPRITMPLEYEENSAIEKLILTHPVDSCPRRVVLMTTEMKARVGFYCSELIHRQADDPFAWVAVMNPRTQAIQFYSQRRKTVLTPSSVFAPPPVTYTMVVDEYVMYHVLLVQDTYRKYHARRRRHRQLRGLSRTVLWFCYEFCAAKSRIAERVELARRKSLNSLHVVIERADGLRAMDLMSSDPFVVIELTDSDGQLAGHGRTSVKTATLHPKWHEEFAFHYEWRSTEQGLLGAHNTVNDQAITNHKQSVNLSEGLPIPSGTDKAATAILHLKVYDFDLIAGSKDEIPLDTLENLSAASHSTGIHRDTTATRPSKKHDFLGMTAIPIAPLVHGRDVTADLTLRDEDGYESPRSRGTLTISIQWLHVDRPPRRNALTPTLLVHARKKTRARPQCTAQRTDQIRCIQIAIDAVITTCQELHSVVEPLVRLYKRWQLAQRSGRTADEAKLLEKRLDAMLTAPFEPLRVTLLNQAAAANAMVTTCVHGDLLPTISEYIDSCRHEDAENYNATVASEVEDLRAVSDITIGSSNASCVAAAAFERTMTHVLAIAQAPSRWKRAIMSLLTTFFDHVPEWVDVSSAAVVQVQYEQLDHVFHDVIASDRVSTPNGKVNAQASMPGSAVQTLAPRVGSPAPVRRALPGVTTTTTTPTTTTAVDSTTTSSDASGPAAISASARATNIAVSRRLERIEKEARREEKRMNRIRKR